MKKLLIGVYRKAHFDVLLEEKAFHPEYETAGEAEWYMLHVITPWVNSVRSRFNLSEEETAMTIKTV